MRQLSSLQLKARDELWRRGELIWLLRPSQRLIYERLKESLRRGESLKFFLNCSRRFGKSFFFCLLAAEYQQKHPEYPVRLGAPTGKSLRKIVKPHFRTIYSTAPMDCRPEWNSKDDAYYFKETGGEINIAGLNNGHEDDLRGTEAGLAIIDECGFVDELEYVVEDVLMPQLLTTGGNLVMGGTPPITPAHPFTRYQAEAMARNNYAEFDIHKAGYNQDVIEKFCNEAGGANSTTWKREYLCMSVVDEASAIVPEWKDAYAVEYPRNGQFYQLFHKYEAMDVGGRDRNATLFGYYDFPAGKLIIEDEVIISGAAMTSRLIAKTTKQKERELWPEMIPQGDDVSKEPELWTALDVYKRVADNNNVILLNDLGIDFGIHFIPTDKDELIAMVNKVRLMVSAGQIIVNPKCTQLIGCLKFGVWDKNRKLFERSASYGHFDALAALVYMVRNLDMVTNPIPAHYRISEATHFIHETKQVSQEAKEIQKLFGMIKG